MLHITNKKVVQEVSPSDVLAELLINLVQSLVEHSDAVTVDPVENGSELILQLRVATSDVGRIIGKQGQTARSLRIILAQAAAKLACRVSLDIVET